MKKANTLPQENTLSITEYGPIASYFSSSKDKDRIILQSTITNLEDSEQSYESDIDRFESELVYSRERIKSIQEEKDETQAKIDALPVLEPVSEAETQADIESAVKLPFVKEIRMEEMSGRPYIVIKARENKLYTTLSKKYSPTRTAWYKVKPYQLALPAYNIRLQLTPMNSLSNSSGLEIQLTNFEEDTNSFEEATLRYHFTKEVHPHWGTNRTREIDSWVQLCLGEYEGEVSSAFRRSIKDGLLALAIYLQVSGTQSAFVKSRERWAIYMGKKEYNEAVITRPKEDKDLKEEAKDEDVCSCRDEYGDYICDDDCECDCGH